MNKKLKPYEKTEVAYKEILEGKKKAYDQKNAVLEDYDFLDPLSLEIKNAYRIVFFNFINHWIV